MTLLNYCEYVLSVAKTKRAVSMSDINAEALATRLLEAHELLQRAEIIAAESGYEMFVESVQNWTKKVA